MTDQDRPCLVVAYHAVGDVVSAVSVTPEQLESDLRGFQEAGFSFRTLDECAEWLEAAGVLDVSGERSVPTAVITFDDGYRSVLKEGVPVLRRFGVSATIYAVAGRLGEDNRWPGQWPSVPDMALLSADELRELASQGHAIGAHSWSHASLPGLPPDALHHEIIDSGEHLSSVLDMPIRHFAYPYGHRGAREVAMAASAYRTAASSHPARTVRTSVVHDLPRIDPHDLRVALRLGITGGLTLDPYLTLRRTLRRIRRPSSH